MEEDVKRGVRRSALLLAVLAGALALPAGSRAEVENPYVSLYRQRLAVARAELRRQASVAENARVNWERMRRLADGGAVPRIEADAQETAWKVAVKDVAIANAEVAKAEALLAIARERIAAGLDMPVCTDDD
jgi:multidrug resistance efflux pump